MAKSVFQVRQNGTQFYLNTESSSPNTGHRNRYRLFKTENFGRDKAGWVQVGSQLGQQLMAIEDDSQRFLACVQAFAAKRPHQYRERRKIRGLPGNWEGEAFPMRVTRSRDATVSLHEQNLTRQKEKADDHADP